MFYLRIFSFITHLMKYIRPYGDPRILAIGMIAYGNGIPLLLTSSTLAVWLKDYGLSYSAIGLFSLVQLPYNFKFLWAPVLDQVQIPYLGRYMGQRRSWLFILQLITIVCLGILSRLSPTEDLTLFVSVCLLTSVAAASQHVLLLAYQVQTIEQRDWGVGESLSVFGFRMAILTSGAGALYMASWMPWQDVYLILAAVMVVCLVVVLIIPEPHIDNLLVYKKGDTFSQKVYLWFKNVAWKSYADFMKREGWVSVLVFMLIFRAPDYLLGAMPTLFFLDLGFSKVQVAEVSKFYGLIMTILGGFVGGVMIREWRFKKTLLIAGYFHGFSMLFYLWQNAVGYHIPTLYATISLENFSGGMGLTAFFSYQLTQCKPQFAATQLALMTATVAISQRIGGVFSGILVDNLGWNEFFSIVALSAIPGVLWIHRLRF